jgi:o-succinylbenzoate---CoA ligase
MSQDRWFSDETEILLNPRMPDGEQILIRNSLQQCGLKSHFWLSTSGSTGKDPLKKKMVALSKEAILSSAKAVNEFLDSGSKDIWLNPLPEFHVGGLGILARSFLSGAKVSSQPSSKWNVHEFYTALSHSKATLTALVPTQVYDLLMQKLKAPNSLRALIVGGGALQEHLYKEARELGWNLLPSYGLTECASQVATAELSSLASREYPTLKIMPHVELKIDAEGYICIKSPALLTTYAFLDTQTIEVVDPKQQGWLTTQDLGALTGHDLQLLGRKDDFVKIGGESVALFQLEKVLDQCKLKLQSSMDAVLIPMNDQRLGFVIHLVVATDHPFNVDHLVEEYQRQVLPFERIRHVHLVRSIPRSPLGKLLRAELFQLLA